MLLKLYNPEVFQGNLKKISYFEGWYFKHVSGDLQQVWSFIPGVALTSHDPHSFIQVINGITGNTEYIKYPLEQFSWESNRLFVKIGDSVFTGNCIDLNIDNEDLKLTGHIAYNNIVKYPQNLLSPGIMGWYSFVPAMECKHGIVSVNHDLKGNISINGRNIDLDNGKGYIEKDWGTSFPEAWIWVQSNNFNEHDTSFMLSIAKIPWMGRFFTGLISFLYLNKQFYLFSTYNKSVFSVTGNNKDDLEIILKNRTSELKIKVIKNSFCDLKAPVSGEMSRRIKESIDSEVHLQLFDRNGIQEYEGTGKSVGLEIIEGIFNYI